jgi:hypothetical protein
MMLKVFVLFVLIIIVQFIWFFVKTLEINENMGYIIIVMILPMFFNIWIMGA